MTTALPQLQDWHENLLAEVHTSDLTSNCDMRVQLKHQGFYTDEMATACFRGRLAEEAVQYLHQNDLWSDADARASIPWANAAVDKSIEEEGTTLTDSVVEKRDDIAKEVLRVVKAYVERLGPWFKSHTLVGLQVPMNLTLDKGGRYGISDDGHSMSEGRQLFASHIDMITRDVNGTLWFFDWKYTESAIITAMIRSPQFALYYLAGRHGSFLLDPVLDTWASFEQWPVIAMIHLPSLKPWGKKGTCRDDQGVEVEYARGAERPMNRILRDVPFKPEREDAIAEMLLSKVRAWRDGHFPMKPSDS